MLLRNILQFLEENAIEIGGLCFILLVYSFIRFGFPASFIFEYDIPHQIQLVTTFLESGDLLRSQYFIRPSIWGHAPPGPALLLFFAPFVWISRDPWLLSLLFTSFNALSVLVLYVIGRAFFSRFTGFFAALLLAVQPYWVFYSRLTYQPAAIMVFVPLTMYFAYQAGLHNNRWAWLLLFPSLFWLIQLYVNTLPFVAATLLFLLMTGKHLFNRYTLLGLLTCGVMAIPSMYFMVQEPQEISQSVAILDEFSAPQSTTLERVHAVWHSHWNFLSGGHEPTMFGYALLNFRSYLQVFSVAERVLPSAVFLVIVLLAYLSRRSERMKAKKVAPLLGWVFMPIAYLSLVRTSELTPRYFLSAIPALCLAIAYFFDGLRKWAHAFRPLPYLSLSVLLGIWLGLTIRLHTFVDTYSYPQGKLRDILETPYFDLLGSLEWIREDAVKRGYTQVKFCTYQDAVIAECGFGYASIDYLAAQIPRYKLFANTVRAYGQVGYYLFHYAYESDTHEELDEVHKYGPFVVSHLGQANELD